MPQILSDEDVGFSATSPESKLLSDADVGFKSQAPKITVDPASVRSLYEKTPIGGTVDERAYMGGATDPFSMKPMISSADVPSGEDFASTGIPKSLAYPLSSAYKTGADLAGYITSPRGAVETVAAASPVGLAMRLKWYYDMAKGTGENAAVVVDKWEKFLKDPKSITQDDLQQLSDSVFAAGANFIGAAKLGEHEYTAKTGVPLAPINRATAAAKVVAKSLNEHPDYGNLIGAMASIQPAIKAKDGTIHYSGADLDKNGALGKIDLRHDDIEQRQKNAGNDVSEGERGFLNLQDGKFYNRADAAKLAEGLGIETKTEDGLLHSDDIRSAIKATHDSLKPILDNVETKRADDGSTDIYVKGKKVDNVKLISKQEFQSLYPNENWDLFRGVRRDTKTGQIYLKQRYSDTDPIFNHEIVHLLRDSGFISDAQWNKLKAGVTENEFGEQAKLMYGTPENLQKVLDASSEMQRQKIEDDIYHEAIAVQFENIARGKAAAKPAKATFANAVIGAKKIWDSAVGSVKPLSAKTPAEVAAEIQRGKFRGVDKNSKLIYDAANGQAAPTENTPRYSGSGIPPSPEGLDAGESPEVQREKSIRSRPEAEPNPEVAFGADAYNKSIGLPPMKKHYVPIDEVKAREIAAEYHKLPKFDRSAQTIAAYNQLGNEIQAQWDWARNNMGINFERWTDEGQPYANSREMVKDVRDNHHLYFFTGGEEHPFLNVPDSDGLTLNDKLRAVHDLESLLKKDGFAGYYSRTHDVAAMFHKMPAKGRVDMGKESPYGRWSKAPLWSDNILTALDDLKQEKISPDQLKAHLLKHRGAKDQADWIGLDEFLSDKKSVTKSEVADFVKSQPVQLNEVVKSSEKDEYERYKELYNKLKTKEISDLTPSEQSDWERLKDTSGSSKGDTKFEQYQTPGGSNYRELLLTLPEKRVKAVVKYVAGSPRPWKVFPEGESTHASSYETEAQAKKSIEQFPDFASQEGAFKSSHFDEPNIVGHIRFNERTSTTAENPEPVKTLHSEEFQSDLHQKGRKKGYKSERKVDTAGWTAKMQNPDSGDGIWSVYDNKGEWVNSVGAESADSAIRKIISERRDLPAWESNAEAAAVPNAPFKTSWPMLLFKRFLAYAIDHGYERVTWTTGDMQNERYDLSKQVDSIKSEAVAEAPGVHLVDVDVKGEGKIYLEIENGKVREATRVGGNVVDTLKDKPLDEVIGKEMADRILSQEPGTTKTYSGLDLKVGGEGMKGFYDKILPNEVNKFVKKMGGKVGVAKIVTGRINQEFNKANNLPLIPDETESVHSLDITPAMRESRQKGMPRFSKSKPVEPSKPERERPKFGVRHDSLVEQAQNNWLKEIERGTGAGWVELVKDARERIAAGEDPYAAWKRFTETGSVNDKDLALLRAHAENLFRDLVYTADRFGENSSQFKEAQNRYQQVQETFIKPQATVWSRVGQALQGETDVFNGSFFGLKQYYKKVNGKEPTPQVEKKLKAIADKGKQANKQEVEAKNALAEHDFESAVPTEVDKLAKKVWDKLQSQKMSAIDRIKARLASGSRFSRTQGELPMQEPLSAEQLADYAEVGGILQFEGLPKDQWATRLISEVGDQIAPHINQIWDAAEKRKAQIEAEELKAVKPFTRERVRQKINKGMTPQDRATMEALDAANKVVRANAAALAKAEAELESTTASVVDPQEKAKLEALAAAGKVVRGMAVDAAKEEAKPTKAVTDPQEKAKQAALDAASRVTRRVAAESAEEAAATAPKAKPVVADAKAVQKAIDKVRAAAIKLAEAENKRRIAAANTKQVIGSLDYTRTEFSKWKSGDKITPEQGKALWSYIRRAYIDKGEMNFDEIRHKVSVELGMKPEDVAKILSTSQSTKRLMDDAWRKQQIARRVKNEAMRMVYHIDQTAWERAIKSIPARMFALKVGFHGTVALGTHAPMVAFQPQFWKAYLNDFFKMYRYVGSPAFYEMEMANLMNRDNFATANRAGLVNDPYKVEDFDNPELSRYIGRLSGMGNRGYAILKVLRQDMFDQHWDSLPDSEKTPEMAQEIAKSVNHATGVVKANIGGNWSQAAATFFFAPKLAASRVMWLVGDPTKAAKIGLNWGKATPEQKWFAKQQFKEKLTIAATTASLLALNQAILSAIGSDQKINVSDPMKSDFGKFKAGGFVFSYGNPMITMARLPLRLWSLLDESKARKRGTVYADESIPSEVFKYARTQFSPFAGVATDLALGRDFMERPLPRAGFGFIQGSDKVPARLAKDGITAPYTWHEYVIKAGAPIPFQEAVREHFDPSSGKGFDQWMKMIAISAAQAGTGGRATQEAGKKTIFDE